ncbi:MAG: phosphate ABC transporter permease PstA [Gemmatimonadetes bacterium]|nr:phosphate ABC transporter permease PstA [Gemmatimonadota bacterium]NNL29488.1 phosphate ABC transporter permease PstA [Gemmatimonadota bacterium]
MGPLPLPRGVSVSAGDWLTGSDAAFDRRRKLKGAVFAGACGAATLVGVVSLGVLLVDVIIDGIASLDWRFVTALPSRFPERAGIKVALAGSVWILVLTALISFPLSVAAAIYLEEYANRGWVSKTIQTNIANLAGVPSIVYGILGLALFVRGLGLGRSVLSGALTLSLLIMPVIIIAAQEAIRAVPPTIREAAYGLGATRWQVVSRQVLPMALPGILTGTILALSRAVGETAPLIMVGAVGFIAFTPEGPMSPFTVLPLQIYQWVSRPQDEFRAIAAAGIIVLLLLLLSMNAVAIVLRNRYSSKT